MAVETHWSRQYDSCISCGSTDRPHKGMGYCKKCYKIHKHDIMPVGVCAKCDRTGKGYRNKESGDFICYSCRASRVQRCTVCEKHRRIKMKLDHGVRVCEQCSKSVMQGKCVHCGQSGTVITSAGEKPVCPACFVRPVVMCSVCQQAVKYYKHDPDGKVLCKKCYRPKPQLCVLCGGHKYPHKRVYKGNYRGYICVDCYVKPLRECSVCGEQKVGHHKTAEGKFVCKDCYYSNLFDQGIADIRGTFSLPWVERLFLDYLEEKDKIQNSETVYKAVERDKPLFEKLGEHFSGPNKITHEEFWRHFHRIHRTRTGQMYAFLIEKGYLPHTDTPTDDFIMQQRTLALVESIPEGFREVARAYHNRLLTVRHKKINAGWKPHEYGVGTYGTIEVTLVLVGKFIRALDKAGLRSFSEITSDVVDGYIAKNLNNGGVIIELMHWLHREKYVLWKYKSNWKALKYGVAKPIHQDKYDHLVNQFMNGIYPLKESILFLFALIYGIRVNTIRGIRITDLREDGGKLFLKLPYVELELHKEIATLVQKYLNETFIINPFDIDNPYLFYGYTYKEPMNHDSIMKLFRKHGIQARQIVPTAIRALFDSKVRHPRVWMELLGINRATAAKYYESFNPTALEEMNINKRLYGSVR